MPHDGSRDDSIRSRINRRKFVRLGLASTAIGLAGCSGDSDSSSSPDSEDDASGGGETSEASDTGDSGGQPVRNTFYSVSGRATPTDAQYNPYNPTNSAFNENNSPGVLMYDWLMKYNPTTGEFERRIVDELSVDGKTVTMKLREDMSWSNGDALTAEDVLTQYELERYQELPTWDNLEDVTTTGEYELKLTLEQPANEGILLDQINMRIEVNRNEYADWLDRLEDASSDSAVESVLGEFLKWGYPEGYPNKMPVSNGPFELTNVSEDTWQLEYRDEYPIDVNFDKAEYTYMTSSEAKWGKMIAGDFDGVAHLPSPTDVAEQYPDYMEQVTVPAFVGLGLHFQHDHPVLGNRKFRQALAYLADRERIASQTLPRFKPRSAIAGLASSQISNWVNTEQLIEYGMGSRPDSAAQALRDGGFSKSGGKWMAPDGGAVSLEILTPPWTGPKNHANIWKSVLSEFGVGVNIRQAGGGTVSSKVISGDFQIASWFAGGGPHPYNSFQPMGGSRTQNQNVPLTPDLPPNGQPDAAGQSFDVADAVSSMPTTRDSEEMTSTVNRVAWYYNYMIPQLGLTQGSTTSFLNGKDFTFPPTDDPGMKIPHPNYDLLRQTESGGAVARLQSKTE
jgi:peptide/nickel transport system substrate-binding protein